MSIVHEQIPYENRGKPYPEFEAKPDGMIQHNTRTNTSHQMRILLQSWSSRTYARSPTPGNLMNILCAFRRSASLGRGRQVGSWQVHCASAFFNIYLRITIASNIERRDL